MSEPDFEALRAERNKSVQESMQNVAEMMGCPVEQLQTNYNPDKCYCACSTGGPCEHKWDGGWVEIENGGSASCSRCGCLAISHDMRCF